MNVWAYLDSKLHFTSGVPLDNLCDLSGSLFHQVWNWDSDNGISFSYKKEQNNAIYSDVDGPETIILNEVS